VTVDPEGQVELPRFVLGGYSVIRYSGAMRENDEDDLGINWKLCPAISDRIDFVIVGDLTIYTETMFSGIQIVCYVGLPWRAGDPLTDDEWELADQLLEEFAPFVSHGMYDYAGQAMRTQLAGFMSAHQVPRHTPPYKLINSSDENVVQHHVEQAFPIEFE